ncbi:MAG: hypothetical protein NTW28_25485 [Candidatus Solibacter sp.]|nr:hypothetical protein [Candidatus Solibacter sp.]
MVNRILVVAALIGLASLPIRAADVPIVNAGFEEAVPPCGAGAFCDTAAVPGWTKSPATAVIGTWRVSTRNFPAGAPEGVNAAYIGYNGMANGSLSQTLSATLQPNTAYTLVYSVGARLDAIAFGGYSVELRAGSTILASSSSPTPRTGTFVIGQVIYSSINANPGLLGQRLEIRLIGLTPDTQESFDKISLDATPTSMTSSASQIAVGGAWKTSLTLVNLSAAQNPVRVAFRGDDGRPLTLPFVVTQQGATQAASGSSVERTVQPGATLLIESEAPSSATVTGWAEVISSGPVAGFAIFRQRGPDSRDSEGTSPLESGGTASLLLPFDNTAGFVTGVALVNATSEAVIVTATIRDDNGAQIGLQAVALPAMGHTSFGVTDRFSMTSGRRGIIEFRNTAGGAVTGLGLRFSSFGSFTSIPPAR